MHRTRGLGLLYRGYAIEDLAAHCQFEEIAYLLMRDKLPTTQELAIARLSGLLLRTGTDQRSVLEATPGSTHPMDVIKLTVTLLGALFSETTNLRDKHSVFSLSETLSVCDRIVAVPSALCYHHHFHHSHGRRLETKAASAAEGVAEHLMRLLHGREALMALDGHALMVSAVDTALVSTFAEHGMAASTFGARVTASTLSDSYSAVCSAVCAIKGPLHGGGNEKAMELITSFEGDAERARNSVGNN